MDHLKLAIIGFGVMGRCISNGLLDAKIIHPHQVQATIAPNEPLPDKLQNPNSITVSHDNYAVLEWANLVLLCVKPFAVDSLLSDVEMVKRLRNKTLVSIVAGIKLDQYVSKLGPSVTVIRAMPNTPCQVRCGMTVLAAGPNVETDTMKLVTEMFAPLGRCRIMEEKQLDAVTGLSGSGPAFACVLMEAMADGGVLMGLTKDVALELAAQTMLGTAQMYLETGTHPAIIKDRVTTPAGCTSAGLQVLEEGKIRSVLAKTIQQAVLAAGKLGQCSNK